MDFIKLFEPITINKTRVKNRIVIPAMGLFMTDDYSFNDRYRSFYRERGRGGLRRGLAGRGHGDRGRGAGLRQSLPKSSSRDASLLFRHISSRNRPETLAPPAISFHSTMDACCKTGAGYGVIDS